MVGARNGAAAAGRKRAGSSQQPAPPSPSTPHHGRQPPSSAQASGSKDGMKTRQKRVVPSRSRRGGPGVGSCETDMMILETLKRKAESEPLIPATTKFLLTTNGALLPPVAESSEAQLNTHAFGRYFDRPEVQRAYKAQQEIQTPEFTELPQDANVGGRFRPRGSEDEALDTSDAMYEKRHRKYESFERRVRLREKEKLKHEHYKLKERIDQLRAMDSSAFLVLPASDFPDARDGTPGASGEQGDVDTSNLHGAAAYHEGERRRKEMLDTALQLEQRYRTLLPPDRRWMEKKSEKPHSQAASADVVEDEEEVEEIGDEDEGEDEPEEDGEDELVEDEGEEGEPEQPEDDGESEIDPEEFERERSKKLKLRIKFPPRMLANKLAAQEPKPPPSRGGGKQITLSPFFKHAGGGKGPKALAHSPLRSASYTASETTSKRGRYSADTAETLYQAPSTKRQRVQPSASAPLKPKTPKKALNGAGDNVSVSSSGLAGKKEPAICVLMVAAVRQSSAPTARKTQRHVTAFGVRVPPEIEEVRDFEIPDWVLAPPSASDDGDRQGSYDPSHSYTHGGRSDGGYSASVADGTDYGT